MHALPAQCADLLVDLNRCPLEGGKDGGGDGGQLKREVNLIPSGGLSIENAADFIRSGACAVSGARNFFNCEVVEREGVAWIAKQVAAYIDIAARAKAFMAPLP